VAVEETIRWLGFALSKINYASDSFQRMYDLAEELIKKGRAYVCHCNEAETRLQRGDEDGSMARYRCRHADHDIEDLDVPFLPKDPKMGTRKLRQTRRIFIAPTSARPTASKDYFGFGPGKTVGLLHMRYPVKAVSFTKDEATGGAVTEIKAVFDREGKKKPKTYIKWEPDGSPAAEVRTYKPLFRSVQPGTAPGGFLNDICPDSESVSPYARVETGFYEERHRAVEGGLWEE
jgi:hypothetical protein